VVTAVAVAVNPALEAPAAIVTEAGAVTALLLLPRLTVTGLLAADVSVAVHASVAAPVSDALLQETALSVAPGSPVPLSAIVGALEALLPIVTVPLIAPVDAGSKPMVSAVVCPGFSVMGALTPETENPAPVAVALLRISCAVPEDVTVTVWLVGVLISTLPKAMFAVLRLIAGIAGFSCSAYVVDAPPAVAVSVAVCAVLTAEAVAINPTVEAPPVTVTEGGTVTALLLLIRLTMVVFVAADDSITVQASVPAPVSVALLHETALGAATAGDALCPAPLNGIVVSLGVLSTIVAVPLKALAELGSNVMTSVAD
jgi:hypothetical protein